MRRLKKIFYYTLSIFGALLLVLYGLFYYFSSPSSDAKVEAVFSSVIHPVSVTHDTFQGFRYRKVSIVHDTLLPTLVFVHGTIGSSLDFKSYMKDPDLQAKANMISYDRIGYNYKDSVPVQESIAFETKHLEHVIKDLPPQKVVLVGYSYGGPIALASKKAYRKTILVAPAVYSNVETMPWLIHFYEWKLTRWLVPPIWQEASREKLSHQNDLANFDQHWAKTPAVVESIHGTSDGIVVFENSQYLKRLFPKDAFELIAIEGEGHGLIWTSFERIKERLLKALS